MEQTVPGFDVRAGEVTTRGDARRQLAYLAEQVARLQAERTAVLEQLPCGLLLLDAAGRVVLMNEQAQRIGGAPPDPTRDLAAQLDEAQFFDPATGAAMPSAFLPLAAALAGEPVDNFECVVQPPGATQQRWVQASARPLRDAQGQVNGVVAVVSDVTAERLLLRDLAASEERYRQIVDGSQDGIVVFDLDRRVSFANAACARIAGAPIEALIGRRMVDFLQPADPTAYAAWLGQIEPGGAARTDLRFRRGDGTPVWLETTASSLRDAEGRPTGVLAIVTDVTTRKQAEAALRESEARMRAVVETAVDAIMTIDDHGVIQTANPAAERLFGYNVDELLGQPADLLVPRPARQVHAHALAQYRATGMAWVIGQTRETMGQRKDGSSFPLLLSVSEIRLGDRQLFTGIMRDLSERQAAEAALRHQVLHDTLTGLPNRILLHDRLVDVLATVARGGPACALLLLDLDRFKEVNDTFGHDQGDAILCEVARRLQQSVRASDTVARLGGDEFAVLLPGHGATKAGLVIRRLLGVLRAPISVNGMAMHQETSIGLAVAPAHGEDADTILRHADIAMYSAKHRGKAAAIYQPAQDDYTPERLALVDDLRLALREGGLELHYQPQAALATGAVVGLEALARWPHPRLGSIPPDQFIPMAERTGQMLALTTWALEQAVAQLRAWQDLLGTPLAVAVNISAANLRDCRLPTQVERVLARRGVAAAQLRLEVTESMLLADPGRAREVVRQVADLGVGISIDDFGTGYSNLAYLAQLAVDELKIDRSFVRGMLAVPKHAAIVASTIGLGHALGVRVVAEGVEDQATWDALAALGCDLAQGYFLARPMPAGAVGPWVAERAGRQCSPRERSGMVAESAPGPLPGAQEDAVAGVRGRPDGHDRRTDRVAP